MKRPDLSRNMSESDAGPRVGAVGLDPSELTPDLEPERYELVAGNDAGDWARRDFLKAVGGGIVVFLLVRDTNAVQVPTQNRQRGGGRGVAQEIGAWLHIDENGQITVYTGKVEVGQNIRTSLTQVVADELKSPLDSIQLVMADTQRTPFDSGTFGSQTTPVMARQLRRVASATRELLLDLAASSLSCERAELTVANGKVTRQSNDQTVHFGSLTKGQKITKTVAEQVAVSPPDQWTVAGQSTTKVDGRAIVTGQHRYASDQQVPGMLHARVLRPVSFGASMLSINTAEADKISGAVVIRDGSFVAVAAPTELLATRALEALEPQWETTDQLSGKQLFEHLKRAEGPIQRGGAQGGRGGANRVGSIADGIAAADVTLQQTYTIAYIAHAPLEPRAALAEWQDNKLTVWTGTQRPFGVRSELARALRVPEEDVRVIVPDTGSGYGGKHTGDAAVEAAQIARVVGKPVKLVWTREEEFTWAYFRPAGVIEISSGVRKDGSLTAWEFHNYNSGASAIRTLYDVPNQLIEFHQSRSPLRQGSYRALAATANHFARESHMDELAAAVGMDALQFRLKNLKDPRFRSVLEAAGSAFNWGQSPSSGHGIGIAGGSEKGSYVATCAEVSVDRSTGRVRVIRATSAFECGAIVNPDHLKSQVEGAMVMGLGGALFEGIEFEAGKILNPRFSRYRVPRFADAPEIDVVLLDRKDLPSAGAGETPIVAIAPAIGNAIFSATGTRLRSLPMAPQGVRT